VTRRRPALFRARHFEDVIILVCVRWYLRYSLTYRDRDNRELPDRGREAAAEILRLGLDREFMYLTVGLMKGTCVPRRHGTPFMISGSLTITGSAGSRPGEYAPQPRARGGRSHGRSGSNPEFQYPGRG
jgi:hypothetical protein